MTQDPGAQAPAGNDELLQNNGPLQDFITAALEQLAQDETQAPELRVAVAAMITDAGPVPGPAAEAAQDEAPAEDDEPDYIADCVPLRPWAAG